MEWLAIGLLVMFLERVVDGVIKIRSSDENPSYGLPNPLFK